MIPLFCGDSIKTGNNLQTFRWASDSCRPPAREIHNPHFAEERGMGNAILKLDHDPAPRPARHRRLVSVYDLAQVAFFFLGFPRNGFGSIDVTSRCNLRCRHCYFFEQDLPEELTVAQWVAKLEGIR